MQYKKLLTLMLIVLSIASCKQQNAAEATAQQTAENPSKDVLASESGSAVEPGSLGTVSPSVPVPDARSVLFEIYKEKVEEISSSQLSDGRYVSYWNGQPFSYQGRNYFVAFTEATPASEIEYPAPEDKVTLSQATYEFIDNQWQLKKVQHDIGKFGGNNKAPAVDTIQKKAVFQNLQGKLLLAIPAVISANMGTQLFFNEIFAFSLQRGDWKYLGNIEAGLDNSAGCARDTNSTSPIQCAKNSGVLEFTSTTNSDWPELKVTLKGSAIGKDGKVFNLPEKNTITYRYDENLHSYRSVP